MSVVMICSNEPGCHGTVVLPTDPVSDEQHDITPLLWPELTADFDYSACERITEPWNTKHTQVISDEFHAF